MNLAVKRATELDIRPLSDALGAEVRGLDLTRPVGDAIDETARAALVQAFLTHHLLCVRAAPLTPRQFAAFAAIFGVPQRQLKLPHQNPSAAVPEVSLLVSTYETAADKPAALDQVRLSGWHTDDSYFAVPAKATLLQALDIPPEGGETRFCNACAAYDDLDDAMKASLDGLQAVHGYDTPRAPARAQAQAGGEARETPDVVHPLVRRHDETGRRALYFNSNRTDRVVGMDRAASDALLDWIHAHMIRRRYRYDHHWRPGDILVWDNRALIHSVNVDYPVGAARRHQRILLKGSRPV